MVGAHHHLPSAKKHHHLIAEVKELTDLSMEEMKGRFKMSCRPISYYYYCCCYYYYLRDKPVADSSPGEKPRVAFKHHGIFLSGCYMDGKGLPTKTPSLRVQSAPFTGRCWQDIMMTPNVFCEGISSFRRPPV